jgi:long-chain acyl-CoA synthetase
MLIDLEHIKKELLEVGRYLKDAKITLKDGEVFATLYPDFKALQKAHIINIKEQLKWYAVELYNITAKVKIKNYTIARNPHVLEQKEPNNETYKTLKNYLMEVSKKEVLLSSHLEFDLGLDSLEYVKLFLFIEKCYGVYLDEKRFSTLMVLGDLYGWVKEHEKKLEKVSISWKDLFMKKSKTELIYSPWVMRAWKSVLWTIFKPYFRLEIHGAKNIPKGPCIIAPNHYSMIDGFVVLASLPLDVAKDTFFLAFEGEFGKPMYRAISKHSQSILIDHNKNLINSMQNVTLPLLESKNVVIFPEGARSRDGKLLPFKQYFAILSKELQVPIVPVVIKGTFDAMPTGVSMPRPKKVTIRYLKPIYPKNLDYDAISKKTKEAISKALII